MRTAQRSFDLHTVGILRHGEKFAVAQLAVSGRRQFAAVEADLCVLRSKVNSSDHSWKVETRLPIMYQGVESSVLAGWRTDSVIPFNKFLCWVCYRAGGILLCKVFKERPVIEYLRLPICYEPGDSDLHNDINSCVCTTKGGSELMFINVSRNDEKLVGPISPGTGFIIYGHILRNKARGRKQWDKVLVISSDRLWDLGCFPQKPLIFPLVNMVKPNVLYFLLSEEAMCVVDKVFVLAFDTATDEVSILPYIVGQEDLNGEDADMVMRKSHHLDSFIPSEFPRFLRDLFSERRIVTLQKKGKKTTEPGKKTTKTKTTAMSRSSQWI